MHERQRLLAMIRKYDFYLNELQLYLDTHPQCHQAMRMWQNYHAMRQKAVASYVRQFGPLQPMQIDTSNGTWNWIQGPWPWEKEAN